MRPLSKRLFITVGIFLALLVVATLPVLHGAGYGEALLKCFERLSENDAPFEQFRAVLGDPTDHRVELGDHCYHFDLYLGTSGIKCFEQSGSPVPNEGYKFSDYSSLSYVLAEHYRISWRALRDPDRKRVYRCE